MTSDPIRAAIEQLRADLDGLREHKHDISGRWFTRGTTVIADDGTDVGMLVVEAYNPAEDEGLIGHIALTASPHVTEAQWKLLEAIPATLDFPATVDPWEILVEIHSRARALATAITRRDS